MNHKQVGFRQLLCEVRAFHIKFYESSIHESNTNLKTKPNMSKGNFCKGRPWIEGLKRDSKKFDSNPSSHPNQLYDFPNPSSKNRFFFQQRGQCPLDIPIIFEIKPIEALISK